MLNKKNNPIGIFDSGIGGLSVLKEAIKLLPNEDFIYFCDEAHVPYGRKKPKELKKYIEDSIDFLIDKKVKAILVACNTATSIAINDLREKYPNILFIGMEPAIKPALENKKGGRVIVLATPVTLDQDKFYALKERLDKDEELVALPVDELAGMIDQKLIKEEGKYKYFEEIKDYLEKVFHHFDLEHISVVVLGCTHYLFIQKYLQEILPRNIKIIDGNQGTVNHLKKVLEQKDLLNSGNESGKIKFYSSGHDFIDIDRVFKKIMENYLD